MAIDTINHQDAYHTLLLDYARGSLDEAFALLVATHLALDPQARRILSHYESIGGALLNRCCVPVSMKKDALQSVLDRIGDMTGGEECKSAGKSPCEKAAEAKAMPLCLQKYIEAEDSSLPWKNTQQGLRTIAIKTTCRGSKATLVKIERGTIIPERITLGGVTLVLEGAMEDGSARYQRGNLIINRPFAGQRACDEKESFCLVVTSCPSRLKQWFVRLRLR